MSLLALCLFPGGWHMGSRDDGAGRFEAPLRVGKHLLVQTPRYRPVPLGHSWRLASDRDPFFATGATPSTDVEDEPGELPRVLGIPLNLVPATIVPMISAVAYSASPTSALADQAGGEMCRSGSSTVRLDRPSLRPVRVHLALTS